MHNDPHGPEEEPEAEGWLSDLTGFLLQVGQAGAASSGEEMAPGASQLQGMLGIGPCWCMVGLQMKSAFCKDTQQMRVTKCWSLTASQASRVFANGGSRDVWAG